jgi:hypothetical protein
LDETNLAELPVLTKTELMEHFDDVVTDRRLSLAGLEQHLGTVETEADQEAVACHQRGQSLAAQVLARSLDTGRRRAAWRRQCR